MIESIPFSVRFLKAVDYLDYVAGVSTVKSLVEIFVVYAIIPSLSDEAIDRSRFLTNLTLKKPGRMILVAIPILGNLLIALFDFARRGWSDKTFVLEQIKRLGAKEVPFLDFASTWLRNDDQFVLDVVSFKGSEIVYASNRLKNIREIGLAAVKSDPRVFVHLGPACQDDEEIVREVMPKAGDLLPDVSERLKNNREIVDLARKSDPNALRHAGPMVWNMS